MCYSGGFDSITIAYELVNTHRLTLLHVCPNLPNLKYQIPQFLAAYKSYNLILEKYVKNKHHFDFKFSSIELPIKEWVRFPLFFKYVAGMMIKYNPTTFDNVIVGRVLCSNTEVFENGEIFPLYGDYQTTKKSYLDYNTGNEIYKLLTNNNVEIHRPYHLESKSDMYKRLPSDLFNLSWSCDRANYFPGEEKFKHCEECASCLERKGEIPYNDLEVSQFDKALVHQFLVNVLYVVFLIYHNLIPTTKRRYGDMRMNRNVQRSKVAPRTHEGAKAKHLGAEEQLRRALLSCFLWEDQFYESGKNIVFRISELVPQVDPYTCAEIAIEARNDMYLRHAPLLLAREMVKHPEHKKYVADVLEVIIQRPDEMSEFLSLYWSNPVEKTKKIGSMGYWSSSQTIKYVDWVFKKSPIAAQVKKGLAAAFTKFDAYQLAKWDRQDRDIKLRDVLFMVHAKPESREQAVLWKQLVDGCVPEPNTWERRLSSGEDKKTVWEDLMATNKLGVMAFLMNLRNMEQAGVSRQAIVDYFGRVRPNKLLPTRFISAAKVAPQWEPELEQMMFKCVAEFPKVKGHTILLVDVSGSMDARIADKSERTRLDAACGLSIMAREVCESLEVFSFSNQTVRVPARRGFGLSEAIVRSQSHGGTRLGEAVKQAMGMEHDRIICISDEQSHDPVPDPKGLAYMINVASYQNGIGYGKWNHIDGWSDKVLNYIASAEDFMRG